MKEAHRILSSPITLSAAMLTSLGWSEKTLTKVGMWRPILNSRPSASLPPTKRVSTQRLLDAPGKAGRLFAANPARLGPPAPRAHHGSQWTKHCTSKYNGSSLGYDCQHRQRTQLPHRLSRGAHGVAGDPCV